MPDFKIKAARLYMLIFRKQKSLAPGQHHFNPVPNYENSSTLSRARFDYIFNQRLEDKHYRTAGATLGWVMAGIDVSRLILRYAGNIKIPVALMQAGKDSLVKPEGFSDFMVRVPQARLYRYENSKHEIFNAADRERRQYFADVLDIFKDYLR